MAEFYHGQIPIIETDRPATNLSHPPGVRFGLIPRDYSRDPEPMFAPPSDMVLIPQSDWDARYDEQEATQSSLEHIYLSGPNGGPAFVNLDQNGDGYCATADTEVLTEKGFVPYPEYNWTDLLGTVNPLTHAMEFQAPFQKHVYDYDGPMLYSTNRRVDFGVTPDHQMYVRKWDEQKRTLSPNYSFVRAGDMGWYCGLLHAPSGYNGIELVELEVTDDRRYDGDDFLALLSLIVSDGYAGGSENTRNWVSFCCFRPDRHAVVSALAARVGFHEKPGRPGVWMRYDAGALASWIRANCYDGSGLRSINKRVPDLVKCASMRQINHFLAWFGDRDHVKNPQGHYYSSSKRLIDDLQELNLRIGKRGTISTREARRAVYEETGQIINSKASFELHVGEVDRLCIDKKKHIETEQYTGLVYCAAVPNHTLITRRNGTILISSNCWSYSTGSSIMMDRLRRNLPPVRLNPHATAAIIKGGRDEGGWCGQSAKFGREVGYAVEGTGPGQWPRHTRSLKNDTPALRAEMAKYKIEEEWVDLTRQLYDQNLTQLQVATCGFNNIPGPRDYNWWSHSVCGIRWVRIERGSWGQLILNSWKGWGRHGLGVLRGSQAVCNGGLAIRLTSS